MGRFSIDTSIKNQDKSAQKDEKNIDWPKIFPKKTIGIQRNGIIVKSEKPILKEEDLEVVPGCLVAIKEMRLKGYKIVIFFNEPLISQKIVNTDFVDLTNNKLMKIFGQAGILSIDGLLYSTSNFKEDIYALPNNGMLKKAEKDFKVNFKGGYFVGDKITDLKVAESVGAKPILINCGESEKTKIKLNSFANKNLKNKTKIYESLIEFASSLE